MQRVKIGESLSDPLPITIGTFQGTWLGPLLYNIASNDISCHILAEMDGFKITTVRYADDTQLAVTGPRIRLADMSRCLENVLDRLVTWFLQHGMKVNASKTEMIVCGDRKQLSQIEVMPIISFMDRPLKPSSHVKNRCYNGPEPVMAFAFETCIPAMFRHFSGLGTCKTSFAPRCYV